MASILRGGADADHDGPTEADMRDHFSYLTDEPSGAFFQKLAEAKAAVPARAVAVAPMAKTASAASPFEKIAGRLDRDLAIIRDIGPRGVNAGMQKRADAYIDHILNQADLTEEEFGEVFDKIAAAAIMGDLEAAFQQLTEGVPEELHHVVEQTLAKVGHDLISIALLEKEANLLSSAGKWLGRGVGHLAEGAGAAAAGGAVAKGMARRGAIRTGEMAMGAGRRAVDGVKSLARKGADPYRASRQAKTMAAGAETVKNLERAKGVVNLGGKNSARGADAVKALEGKVGVRPNAPASRAFMENADKAVAKASEKTKASMGFNAKPPEAPKPPAPPAPVRATEPAKAGESKAIKADSERAKAESDAGEAAASKERKPAQDAKDGPEAAKPAGGADPKPPADVPAKVKATDAFKKWSENGWAALSPAEKGAMIRAGVVGAVGYRAVTGKGAVTDGEGLV